MDGLARTVREQVALGRLLPLGGPQDAAWIAEQAVAALLRRSALGVAGVRLGAVSVSLADGPGAAPGEVADRPGAEGPLEGGEVAAPEAARAAGAAPVGALPHVPLRIEAGFEATAALPLPDSAERLRSALWSAARDGVGLAVAAVDLRVTGLLESDDDAVISYTDGASDPADRAAEPAGPVPVALEAVRKAVRAVPGVAGLTGRLPGLGPGVRMVTGPQETGSWVQVQLAVAPGEVPLTVAREVAVAARAVAVPAVPVADDPARQGGQGGEAVGVVVVVTDA